MVDSTQLEHLNIAKARALVARTFPEQDFDVEVKNSAIADGVKANHLSYIGDAKVGKNSNIGAGTITCNYDGNKKSITQIGEEVFIGSNTALVAPVKIGNGAVTGAGSVITKDVEENALALTRTEQNVVSGWSTRRPRSKGQS